MLLTFSSWWVRSAQEKIDHTVQGMVLVYVEQLTRYFKATLDGLFAKSRLESVTGVFSGSSVSKLDSDEAIEGTCCFPFTLDKILPLLTYLDETFVLFNQTLDPKLGDAIFELNPWLRGIVSGTGASSPTKPATAGTSSINVHGFQDNSSHEFMEPNILMKLVWQSYLKVSCLA